MIDGPDPSPRLQPIVIEAKTAHLNITPFGFLRWAKEYLRAADACPPTEGFSPVPYFLFCRSIELALKAFLLARGETVKDLKKKVNHNLVRVLGDADGAGLGHYAVLSAMDRAEIKKANKYYSKKGFEYCVVMDAVTGYRELPSLVVLKDIAQRLAENLRSVCLNAK
jgi:hypothetical protein